jgi:hypothetical protein
MYWATGAEWSLGARHFCEFTNQSFAIGNGQSVAVTMMLRVHILDV